MPQIWNVVQPLMMRLLRRRGPLAGHLLPTMLSMMLLIVHPAGAMAAASGEAPVDPAVLAKAVDQLEQLDRLRISLASSLEGSSEEPTMDTMRQVCMPVGSRETDVIDLFARHPEINGLWEPATAEQGAGVNDYRRIDVQSSCLACHGSRDNRPAFVKETYPADKAFNFKPGDLRGMYAVHIPELQAALEQAAG